MLFSYNTKFPQATTIATNNHLGKNAVSSKQSDIDYIENEQIPGLTIFPLFLKSIAFFN